MIQFEFDGEVHEIEVTWQHASRIAERVADPYQILAAGGSMGLVQAVRVVSICTGIPEPVLGEYAMKKDPQKVFDAAQSIVLATMPEAEDAPKESAKKK